MKAMSGAIAAIPAAFADALAGARVFSRSPMRVIAAAPGRSHRCARSSTSPTAALALLLAGLISACASTPRQGNEVIERQARFVCSNKEEVEMRFFPRQGVAVLVRHGMPIELQQQPSGSGFVYSNGPNTVRGKGDEITIEIGRMVPLACKAV